MAVVHSVQAHIFIDRLYNQFSVVLLDSFHQLWKSSFSFGQAFCILEDAPYSTGSFIDDEDPIWFDL